VLVAQLIGSAVVTVATFEVTRSSHARGECGRLPASL
jgi:hypothetical protein